MRRLGTLGWIAFILLFLGGINWGLVGLFGYNVVEVIFGASTIFTRVIYVLVGISAIYMLAAVSMPDGYDKSIGHDPARQKALNDRRRDERRRDKDTEDDEDIKDEL